MKKMHIRHVIIWEFKLINSEKATARKICSEYSERPVTFREARYRISKFRCVIHDFKGRTVKRTPFQFDDNLVNTVLEQNSRQSTKDVCIYSHKKKK